MNRNRIYSTRTGAQPSNPSTRTKRAETWSNEAAGMSCRTPHPTERRSRTTPHHGRTPFMTRRTGRGRGRAHSDVEPETWAAALTRSSLHPQRRLSAGRFGWSKGSIRGQPPPHAPCDKLDPQRAEQNGRALEIKCLCFHLCQGQFLTQKNQDRSRKQRLNETIMNNFNTHILWTRL